MHCPHADRCPGCALIGVPYPAQLEHKQQSVASALAPYPELARAELRATVPAEPARGSRERVRPGRSLGLFERAAHKVVDIPECLVLRPSLKRVAGVVRTLLPELGGASSVDLRETDQGVLVTLALPDTTPAVERERVAELVARASSEIASVAISRREQDSPRVLGTAPEVLRGASETRHTFETGAPWHYASPGAFTQAHAGQAARLQRAIQAELGESLGGRRVLELYAGSGALGLRLAQAGAELTLVENFPPAVERATRAAEAQGLRLRAITSDAAHSLSRLAGERFDAVIVNPPRRGLDPNVRRGVAELGPARLLYVSCEPRTLARDAAHLALLGYELVQATPLDMIPLSDAVETLAVFRAAPPPPARVLLDDPAFLAVEKVAHEPPANEPSGIALFARTPAQAPALAAALAQAHSEYRVLARGVVRPRGNLGAAPQQPAARGRTRYEREAVVAGHSLIRVVSEGEHPASIQRALARIGHPVLGDDRHGDRRSNAHFEHRHALDRAFFHRTRLDFTWNGQPVALRSELAPDLAGVLAELTAR